MWVIVVALVTFTMAIAIAIVTLAVIITTMVVMFIIFVAIVAMVTVSRDSWGAQPNLVGVMEVRGDKIVS